MIKKVLYSSIVLVLLGLIISMNTETALASNHVHTDACYSGHRHVPYVNEIPPIEYTKYPNAYAADGYVKYPVGFTHTSGCYSYHMHGKFPGCNNKVPGYYNVEIKDNYPPYLFNKYGIDSFCCMHEYYQIVVCFLYDSQNILFLPSQLFRKLPYLPVHKMTSIMTIKRKGK